MFQTIDIAVVSLYSDKVKAIFAQYQIQIKFIHPLKLKDMGTIKQGILGGFSGKVGTVIGASWTFVQGERNQTCLNCRTAAKKGVSKGISYMRSIPQHVKNPRTEGQVSQRSKFALTLNLLKPMTAFLRTGWKLYAHKQTAFNAAMSYTLANAITGTYPDYSIDPSKVLVSRGSLAPAASASATPAGGGTVTFAWEDNSGIGSAKQTDKALLVVANPAKSEAVFDTAGAERTEITQDIIVPADWIGEEVETYMGFISEDNKEVANSVYLGTITIA
jgi:hypothetical protein